MTKSLLRLALLALLAAAAARVRAQPMAMPLPLMQLMNPMRAVAPGGGVLHMIPFPDGPECEEDTRRGCKSVVRMCEGSLLTGGNVCVKQCLTDSLPRISEACRASHPCAADAERHCAGVRPQAADLQPGADDPLTACLKKAGGSLSAACRAAQPCLQPGSTVSCHGNSHASSLPASTSSHAPAFSMHQPFAEQHVDAACSCAGAGVPEGSCSDHLGSAFCAPCGRGCVRNPHCSPGRRWCRVANATACKAAGVTPMGDCSGPYPPDFPACEAAIQRVLHDAPARHRCDVQDQLSHGGSCPTPYSVVPRKYNGLKMRACGAAAPPILDFIRHFLGDLSRPPPLPLAGPPPGDRVGMLRQAELQRMSARETRDVARIESEVRRVLGSEKVVETKLAALSAKADAAKREADAAKAEADAAEAKAKDVAGGRPAAFHRGGHAFTRVDAADTSASAAAPAPAATATVDDSAVASLAQRRCCSSSSSRVVLALLAAVVAAVLA